MSERSRGPQTTTVAFRQTRSSLVSQATSTRTHGREHVPTDFVSYKSLLRGGATSDGSHAEFADLLGIGGQECDAARIIMAAQVRLRLLRQSQPPRHARDRAQQIMQARDVLLRSAVEATHVPVACPR